MSTSEFQNVKDLVKTFTEKPELRKYGSTWGILYSDEKMASDLVQIFENKRKKVICKCSENNRELKS